MLGSAVSLALTFQFVGAHIVSFGISRKKLWFRAAMASRVLRMVALGGAFLVYVMAGGPTAWVPVWLIGFLVVSRVMSAVAIPPWQSWLADLVPSHKHGRFFGRRKAWIALAAVAVLIPAAAVVQRTEGPLRLPVLLAVFVVGGAIGILDLVLHRTIPEPYLEPVRRSLKDRLVEPFMDRNFRPWLVFRACWMFGMLLGGGAIAQSFMYRELDIKNNFLIGTVVIMGGPQIMAIIVGGPAGHLVDRMGIRRGLIVGHLLWAMLPLFWIAASPSTAILFLTLATLTGPLGSNIVMTAQSKFVLRVPPPDRRAYYVAVSTLVTRLAGTIGPLVGGGILWLLADFRTTVAGKPVVASHVLFAASFVCRLASVLLVFRIRERGHDLVEPGTVGRREDATG